jgi:hypothetical protein
MLPMGENFASHDKGALSGKTKGFCQVRQRGFVR